MDTGGTAPRRDGTSPAKGKTGGASHADRVHGRCRTPGPGLLADGFPRVHGYAGVNEETREQVLAAMKELGYRPAAPPGPSTW